MPRDNMRVIVMWFRMFSILNREENQGDAMLKNTHRARSVIRTPMWVLRTFVTLLPFIDTALSPLLWYNEKTLPSCKRKRPSLMVSIAGSRFEGTT
jgi:hypothetical protein